MIKSLWKFAKWIMSVVVLVVVLFVLFGSCGKDTDTTDNDVVIEETEEVDSAEVAEEETAEERLDAKLDEIDAFTAAQEYGEENFSNFKVSFLDQLDGYEAVAKDENTWRFKCKCSVDGVSCWMFADVTGTTANPKVTYFEVHE